MIWIAGGVLATLAVIDYKKKKIPVWPVLAMGVILFLMRLPYVSGPGEVLCSLIPGMVLLLTAFFTKEKIGSGDGLVILCLGMGFGIETMMVMTGAAFILAATVSIVLLLLKKANRKTELPFLPFLFMGWIISVI